MNLISYSQFVARVQVTGRVNCSPQFPRSIHRSIHKRLNICVVCSIFNLQVDTVGRGLRVSNRRYNTKYVHILLCKMAFLGQFFIDWQGLQFKSMIRLQQSGFKFKTHFSLIFILFFVNVFNVFG